MKNLKYVALAIVGMFMSEGVFAQSMTAPMLSGGIQGMRSRVLTDGNANVRFIKGEEKEIIGSPFISDTFKSGVVYFTNGQSGESAALNYDAIDKVLVTRKDGQEYLYDQPIKEFVLNDGGVSKKFRKVNDDFFEVLHDGKTKLLKLHTKAIIESSTYGSAKTTLKVSDENLYFVLGDNNKLEEVKNDKVLLAALGSKQESARTYAKASSLNLKRESDMVKLLSHIESVN